MAEKAHRARVSHDNESSSQPEIVQHQSAAPEMWQPAIDFDPRLGGETRERSLFHLQQTVGNQAVQRMVNRSRTVVNPADDLAQRIHAASSGGNVLDSATRHRLQEGFNVDLSAVRIHTDDEADRLSRSVEAIAFTTGLDIFFRHGAYQPDTASGLRLIAHEAAHTIQQSNGPVDGTLTSDDVSISEPGGTFEREAEAAADRVITGQSAQVHTPSGSIVARSPEDPNASSDDSGWMQGVQSLVRGLLGLTRSGEATGSAAGSSGGSFQGHVPPGIDTPPPGWTPPPPGFVPAQPALHGNWPYDQPVPNRGALGQNVQRDHVIAQAKLRDVQTDPMGVGHYDANTRDALTVLEETGAANAAHGTLPHTQVTFHDVESDVAEINRLRQQGGPQNWADDIIDPSRQARLRSGYDPAAVDRGWVDQMGRLNQSQRMGDTADELARLETASGRSVSPIPDVEDMNWADFEHGPTASSVEEAAESATKGGGGTLGKVLGGANYGLQFFGNLMQGQGLGESAAGAAAGGFVGNRVSGGGWDTAINLANAGLQLLGAPKEITGYTQMAADATPSSFATSLASNAGRGAWNLLTGDTAALKKQGQDILHGKSGSALQGWGMITDLATGGDTDWMTGEAAKRGDYGFAVQLGNQIGDDWFELNQQYGGFGGTLKEFGSEFGDFLWEGATGKGGIKSAANWAGDKLSDAGSAIAGAASDAWDWTSDTASDVGSAIGGAASDAWDWLTDW